jgi:hypothetical protein
LLEKPSTVPVGLSLNGRLARSAALFAVHDGLLSQLKADRRGKIESEREIKSPASGAVPETMCSRSLKQNEVPRHGLSAAQPGHCMPLQNMDQAARYSLPAAASKTSSAISQLKASASVGLGPISFIAFNFARPQLKQAKEKQKAPGLRRLMSETYRSGSH